MRRKPVLTAIACATLALASCNSTSTPEQLTVAAYNFPQNRVTDHRINFSLHQLQDLLDGNLDPIIEPLAAANREERLSA